MQPQTIIEGIEDPRFSTSIEDEKRVKLPQCDKPKKKYRYEVMERVLLIDKRIYECDSIDEISQGTGLISSTFLEAKKRGQNNVEKTILSIQLLE